MPVISENKYLQSLLENLVTTYETEINYTPVEIELDPHQISQKDIEILLSFLKDTRKRFFIFKLQNDEPTSKHLALVARHSILNQTAQTILESTSSEPKINPLKQALNNPYSKVRAGIQIQKSFVIPKQPTVIEDAPHESIEQIPTPDLVLIPIDFPELPVLNSQLKALGVDALHDRAAQKIKENLHAFTDGINPNNMPKGLYIDPEKKALCYTDSPCRLPSTLAPVFEKPELFALPSIEQAIALLPATIDQNTIIQLLSPKNLATQKRALLSVLPTHAQEVSTFLLSQKPAQLKFIIPLLAKLFILGGEAHTCLFTRLIKNCINKKLSIECFERPEVQSAFLSPRGIKNLQKLLQLPAEQKEWWNTLVIAHLKNDKHHFDFNGFFEAYSQIFLPRIAEKNLTLPKPCPINHEGHLLITLNRVLDVLEQAKNPQEQCLALQDLNWGPTGVHYAMTQKAESVRLKQATACMKINAPEDTETDPEIIHQNIHKEAFSLEPWLFRYMGQHWKAEIRLTDIKTQLAEIQNLRDWTPVQKNQLTFILTTTFATPTVLTVEQWATTLKTCINLMQALSEQDRSDLLQALSGSFNFKPNPSLDQIQTLINQCMELKATFPDKNFKEDLIIPLMSCFKNEGFELFNTLQERIQKTDTPSANNQFALTSITSFVNTLQNNRQYLHPQMIQLLAKLNEPQLTQSSLDTLLSSFKTLQKDKPQDFYQLVLNIISQINISKSQPLPNIQQIETLITSLSTAPELIPEEYKTIEQQEAWLKDLIIEKNLIPGCVFGNGDISKLDDLIVDALVDAVKKRKSALDIPYLKECLFGYLQTGAFKDLREQLNNELVPVLDALNDLIVLLQTPNPKFAVVIEKLRFFEEKKPILLESTYTVPLLGSSNGEYILSYLLTGKRKADDEITTSGLFRLEWSLQKLFNEVFVKTINSFFEREENKKAAKDWDAKTCYGWMATLNETLTLTFFFKEELIQKKVLPALTKTLQQLNTQDPAFEKSIMDAAGQIAENEPADQSLGQYRNKIEAIAKYLNLLIDIKDKFPTQFSTLSKQLYTGALARIDYTQKQILIDTILRSKPDSLDFYLKLATNILEENPEANSAAIERAIRGLVTLFKSDLEPETKNMFFKMSLSHNLKSPSPFPLKELNELKKSRLPEQDKSLIIKHIIQILSCLSNNDSPEFIQGLVRQTLSFLTQNPEQTSLCIALLHRVSKSEFNQDSHAYPSILQQLSTVKPDSRGKLAAILTSIANNKKDDTANLSSLLEIARGLGRRSSGDIDRVQQLFATPPYPLAKNLNSALLSHGSEKLDAYCLNFDKNPFANMGEKRELSKHFATDRIQEALLSLQDLIHNEAIPHSLQLQLAKQLTYIETLGYTDPLNPDDFSELKKLTLLSRRDLKEHASLLLQQFRDKTLLPEQIELNQLELLAYLREIYFRTTGLFPNTTQMLVLLLSLKDPTSNLLMRIKTGEGKSIITPMLSVLQWAQGGTVDQVTANPTLLIRDYDNTCEPFFNFLGIKSALIQSNSPAKDYQLNGINCSTIEDMAIFRLAAKESKKEALIQNNSPIHIVLDECDDALLDQVMLYKLVAEQELSDSTKHNTAQWIYPLAYQFINLPAFRNLDPYRGNVWDDEEDLEQFRLFLNKKINEQFNGNIEKQNFLMASSNTQLMQWIHASCKAATLVENKHFIAQPVKEKDESGNKITKKIVCVPLIRSTPKTGSIFTEGVQQALQARLNAERKEQAQYFVIDNYPPVLASQSARGLIRFYQNTKGRLIGVSATPGDQLELQSLASLLGTQAIGVAPYAGDHRTIHPPVFTFNDNETIKAIHHAIESIKLPVTKPSMEINTDATFQTYEERETLIAQTKKAIDDWSQTQTQPILIINEDFDESHTIGSSLEKYKKAGFKVQIVTGKESPEELDRIIKQAGLANTITVGTAMLAKGIDINTGNHPKGLIVIQTYPDSERMTTQIAGRAARNGKPGEWLPIYQIKPPQSFFELLLYHIFPWYRQSINERSITKLQNKIKLQATVDRLYTQAIDETQQTLMQQIQAWEELLLELHPGDPKLHYELYQWRETILSELNRSQQTTLTQKNLQTSIEQFKQATCKLWDTLKEEKWVAKALKTTKLTPDQLLKLNYLKHLDLSQELNIQSELQQKTRSFTAGSQALMHQNLETMIRDKAGAVLEYTRPTEQEKKELQMAQSRKLLPNLLGEFCTLNPAAIHQLIPKNKTQRSSFLSGIFNSALERVIKQKNKVFLYSEERQQITQTIIDFYQKELILADNSKIQALLEQIKPLILAHNTSLTYSSLIEQFKMQGLILTFHTLYQNSGLPEDPELSMLKISYDQEIMKKLANHLLLEMAWVKQPSLHAYLERSVARKAALAIYGLAEEASSAPDDKKKIQALYKGLQEHKVILRDKYLFSLGHTSPRQAINVALAAIDSLNIVPHCDLEFRNECHDTVLAEYHLAQFRDCLQQTSSAFKVQADPVWAHLINSLTKLSKKEEKNQSYLLQELHETIKRFNTYKAYQPYTTQLKTLDNQLTASIGILQQNNGLKLDMEDRLLTEKREQFATLFHLEPNQVRIHKGTNGLLSYIDVQVENGTLQEGFTGYQSSFSTILDAEKERLSVNKSNLATHQSTLPNLSDKQTMNILSAEKKLEFENLFKLKALLDLDSNTTLDSAVIGKLPEPILSGYCRIQQLKKWNWTLETVDLAQLHNLLDKEPDAEFMELLEEQAVLNKKHQEIQSEVTQAAQLLNNHNDKIEKEEETIKEKQERIRDSNCSFMEKTYLNTQILAIKTRLIYYRRQLSRPENILSQAQQDEQLCKEEIAQLNVKLDDKRKEFISNLTNQTRQILEHYLSQTTQHYINEMHHAFTVTDKAIEAIEKTEQSKSRYQRQRFFTSSELLAYQAKLAKEEELIPEKEVRQKEHAQEYNEYEPHVHGI